MYLVYIAALYQLSNKINNVNLAALTNLRIQQYLLPLPAPLNIETVIYNSCKVLSDWEHMNANFVCPGTYRCTFF